MLFFYVVVELQRIAHLLIPQQFLPKHLQCQCLLQVLVKIQPQNLQHKFHLIHQLQVFQRQHPLVTHKSFSELRSAKSPQRRFIKTADPTGKYLPHGPTFWATFSDPRVGPFGRGALYDFAVASVISTCILLRLHFSHQKATEKLWILKL